MSDQHDELRERTRRQRERQYEIERITFEYATEYRNGHAPRIDDYVRRYPQYASELLEYALYFHTVGFDREPLVGPAEPTLSPAAEKALARIRERRSAYAPTPAAVPFEGLVKQGNRLGYKPSQLAEAVGLTSDLIGRLEARAIDVTSIPRALFERLAATLKATPEAIADYLRAPQAGQVGGFFYADQQPTQARQSFLDAVRTSPMLSLEQKQQWTDIVQAETGASE